MWSFSEAGRKHVISFVNNMISLVALFSVCVFVATRMRIQGWESYTIIFCLGLVAVWVTACNIYEFMEAPSKSDVELRRVKKLSSAIHKDRFGFKPSLIAIRFCIRNRKLRIIESIALLFLLVGVMLAVLVGVAMTVPKDNFEAQYSQPKKPEGHQ